MNESEITAYVERSQSLIDQAPQMDEENTKVKLIQPLIDLLGWDVFSSEVELEYPMQIGRGNTRADYALLIETAPVVFIEAKGCDSTLTDADRSQLTSYMRQKGWIGDSSPPAVNLRSSAVAKTALVPMRSH